MHVCVFVQVIGIVRERVLRVHRRGDHVAGYDPAAGPHQSEPDARRVAARVVARLGAPLASVRRLAATQRQRPRILSELARLSVQPTKTAIRDHEPAELIVILLHDECQGS